MQSIDGHSNIIPQLHAHLLIRGAHIVLLVDQLEYVLCLLLICQLFTLLKLFRLLKLSVCLIDAYLCKLLIFLQFF